MTLWMPNRAGFAATGGRRRLRCRGEWLERPFAHVCETGGYDEAIFEGIPTS